VGDVAEQLEVSATWMSGYMSRVTARGHEITIDEPASAGGSDGGMMPTEAFCASIAACFCLALAHVATKRGRELPGLRVVARAQRAGRELRYARFEIEAQAEVAEEDLGDLIEPARRVCWVSNTLASGVELNYRYTSVDAHTRR
jgi:putative redox protein